MIKLGYSILILSFCISLSSCKKTKKAKSKNIKTHHNVEWLSRSSPVLVWSLPEQPDPKAVRPAIFYTPHQDDETIGMGASIAEHVRVGRPVYVVLLTNGANVGMLGYLQNKFNHDATMKDLTMARNNELIAACLALGVHRLYIANSGEGYDDTAIGNTGTPSWEMIKNEFKNTMHFFSDKFPNASHKTTSGNCDSYNTACEKMPAHQAAATALHELYDSGEIEDVRLFRVYCFYWDYGSCDRCSSYFSEVAEVDKLTKQKAIDTYKFVDAEHQRYGLAYYESAMTLFKNCRDSDYEYIDFVSNDY